MNHSAAEPTEVFVGRQPILDRKEKIFGYELLFRSGQGPRPDISSNAKATASVMVNTLNNIGVKKLIGDKKGFVNVDAETLESGVLDLLPRTSTVLEILETVEVTDRVVELCRELRRKGYEIALDDFLFNESYEPLFESVSIVKMDILQYERQVLPAAVKRLRKKRLKLLAEKVETKEDFVFCKDLDFEFFQGYFFAKPSIVAGRSISPTHLVLIERYRLLSREAELFAVETVFRKNPELNVKLLKFMNSASFYTAQKITSIRQAIALLGYRNLQKWVTLLLYAGESDDMKANPLLERAAIRGRLMELLAARTSNDRAFADTAFICGVLSLVDVVFRMPMAQILSELNLSVEINEALTLRAGALGSLVLIVEKLEQNDPEGLQTLLGNIGLTPEDLYLMERNAIIEYENYSEAEIR